MFKMLRKALKGIIKVGLLALLVFGGLTYYFRHVDHLREKLLTRVQVKVRDHQIRPLTYTQIPSLYREAVTATEDRRFSWDPGIDPVGILRSLVVDVRQDGYVEGGSTITQQLVDNTLVQRQKSLRYKLTQAFYAIGIYDTFSKEQTFQMYANLIYFGQGAYGLYNASETYFGKSPGQLNAGELTMLAGLPNAPSVYDPFNHMALARQRQSIVLKNMVDDGLISAQESVAIFKQPIQLRSAAGK